ncbi:MAG: hypothetical protein SOZ00_03450 [Tidjanibacter sp.]|nr:hypothetical protein [Tidjanibacter sp.]
MVKLSVADNLFGYYMREGCRPAPVPRNYAPFVTADTGEPIFTVALDAEIAPRNDRPMVETPYDLQEATCLMQIYPDEYRLHIVSPTGECNLRCPFGEGTLEFESDILLHGQRLGRNIFDHQMVFAYSFGTLLRSKTLLIHSSTVMNGGRGVMFLGESGTGKSTHTKLWLDNIEGSELLNDDGPILRVTDSGVLVYGSPWSGKTPCYKPVGVPLAAMVRLRQAPENRIVKLGAVSGFGALLPSTLPTMQKEERTLDRICNVLSEILTTTPIFMMDCLPNGAAAHLSYETIFALRG